MGVFVCIRVISGEGVCFLIFISCLCLFACFLVALDDNGEERR